MRAGPAGASGIGPGGPGAGEAGAERYNAVELLEANLAAERGGRPYLVTDERAWTYDEVVAAVDAASAGLIGLGLDPGDRVVLALSDRPEFVVAFWAALKAGLVAVPVAVALSPPELAFVLGDSGAAAVVCDASSFRRVRDATSARSRSGAGRRPTLLFVGDGQPEGTTAWATACGQGAGRGGAANESRSDAVPTGADDIALWLYTSGTTGTPKGVMHRHRHLRAASGALVRQVVDLQPDDVVLSTSKMYFAYGLGNSLYLPASVGASAVIDGGPMVPGRLQELLAERRPTVFFSVPSTLDGFVRLPGAALPSSVRIVLSAGESLPAELLERCTRSFGLPPLDGLGATEALHHVTSNRPDDVVPGSAGRPLDGYDVRVLDADGDDVADGASGELWVRGPTTFAGYWGRPDLTARAIREGWMRTGDRCRLVDGRVFHEGRLDDLMKLGGIWVAPREVEDVLRAHPGVLDAAVAPVTAADGVVVLKAFIVPTDRTAGPDLAGELGRWCRRRLASYKRPRTWAMVPSLPRTPSGKLRRFTLRDP
jgi:benzoate-CoA ligase family protein